jgi:hypothetical protein
MVVCSISISILRKLLCQQQMPMFEQIWFQRDPPFCVKRVQNGIKFDMLLFAFIEASMQSGKQTTDQNTEIHVVFLSLALSPFLYFVPSCSLYSVALYLSIYLCENLPHELENLLVTQ